MSVNCPFREGVPGESFFLLAYSAISFAAAFKDVLIPRPVADLHY